VRPASRPNGRPFGRVARRPIGKRPVVQSAPRLLAACYVVTLVEYSPSTASGSTWPNISRHRNRRRRHADARPTHTHTRARATEQTGDDEACRCEKLSVFDFGSARRCTRTAVASVRSRTNCVLAHLAVLREHERTQHAAAGAAVYVRSAWRKIGPSWSLRCIVTTCRLMYVYFRRPRPSIYVRPILRGEARRAFSRPALGVSTGQFSQNDVRQR